jgi:nucleoside-diphosphate-sugar epimerase
VAWGTGAPTREFLYVEDAAEGILLATVHQPYNTDNPENLRNILAALAEVGGPIIFPVHPRTRQKIAELDRVAN